MFYYINLVAYVVKEWEYKQSEFELGQVVAIIFCNSWYKKKIFYLPVNDFLLIEID